MTNNNNLSVAETIREATRKHLLEDNGLLYGQCITAVGWVGGTIPELTEDQGIVELPISDVSNGGVVVGSALVGRRPIYVIRYQGFAFYNMITILNYAAKSLDMWNRPCPVFVRSIGMEGGIGPVASHMHHGMIMRMPGIKIFAPMTPNEWLEAWNYYKTHDDPVYCSEHRLSFNIDYEMPDDNKFEYSQDYVIFAIGAARLNAAEAQKQLKQKGISCSLFHLNKIKPYCPTSFHIKAAERAKNIVVVDSDYSTCGASEHVAQVLSSHSHRYIKTLGIEERAAGFSPQSDVLTPTTNNIIDQLLGWI